MQGILPWASGELQKVLVELSDLTSTQTSVLEKMSVWQKWQELHIYISHTNVLPDGVY